MAGILLVCELIGFHVIMLVETQRGAVTILGVQGRYFLPLIPIAMFTLFTKERKKHTVRGNGILIYCVWRRLCMFLTL